jgi:hypothetical protein
MWFEELKALHRKGKAEAKALKKQLAKRDQQVGGVVVVVVVCVGL